MKELHQRSQELMKYLEDRSQRLIILVGGNKKRRVWMSHWLATEESVEQHQTGATLKHKGKQRGFFEAQ